MQKMAIAILLVIVLLSPLLSEQAFNYSSGRTVQHSFSEIAENSTLCFTENQGQWDSRALFRAGVDGSVIWLTSEGVYYQFLRSPRDYNDARRSSGEFPSDKFRQKPDSVEQMVIQAAFIGSNLTAQAYGVDLLDYKCNYFIGNDPNHWRSDVPNYKSVMLKDVYRGIDLNYYGNGDGNLEYDFIISPGTDYNQIRICYLGAQSTAVNAAGELVIETKWHTITEQTPIIYQVEQGKVREVAGRFLLVNANTFSFELVGDYNPDLPLIIDPSLVYSTYLGGTAYDYANSGGIGVDGQGCAYVTGETYSPNFPIVDAYDPDYHFPISYPDVFITKFEADGNSLDYSTFLGGSNNDGSSGLAVTHDGSVFVTGHTYSMDFPYYNAFDSSYTGTGGDAFVTRLSTTGSALVYSTYLGGSLGESGKAIALDNNNCAYITGYTQSSDFPTQNALYDSRNGSELDVFITKFSTDGTSLSYSTYLGGTDSDQGLGIAVDPAFCTYITGISNSSDFPTQNAYDDSYNDIDAFVAKLSSNGSTLLYSTYLGGSFNDEAYAITVDDLGFAYVAGQTESPDFPTVNPYQTNRDTIDAFVTKLNTSGDNLIYSTYLGGSYNDCAYGIALDNSYNVYVTGYTSSVDFPIRDEFPITNQGDDAFITLLNNMGNNVIFSSYLGGSGVDYGVGLATRNTGAFLIGNTNSEDFPTYNAFDALYNGGGDIFVTRIIQEVEDEYLCGDVDGSGDIFLNISDLVYLYEFILNGAPAPVPNMNVGNVDGLGRVNMADLVFLIKFVFEGGASPGNCPDTVSTVYPDFGTDSIYFGTPIDYPSGDSVAIPVYLTNSIGLKGLSVGIHWTSANTDISSINIDGTIASSSFGGVEARIDTLSNILELAWCTINTFDTIPVQSGGLLCTLNGMVSGKKGDAKDISFEFVFVPPCGDYIFCGVDECICPQVFVGSQYNAFTIDTADVYQAQTADLDRDNFMDVIYNGSSEVGLFVKYGDPLDTLTDPIKYLDVSSAAITVDYLDRDSLLDIAASDENNLYLLINQGYRNFQVFTLPLPFYKHTGRQTASSICSGLFNADIDLDLVVAPDLIFYSDGLGSISNGISLPFSFQAVNAGDFDRNGQDDLLVLADDSIKLYINSGSGNFTKVFSIESGPALSEVPISAAVADFNHDRWLDFVMVVPQETAGTDSSIIWIGISDQTGVDFEISSIVLYGNAYMVLATDLNRDRHLDIVAANGTVQRLEIYYGDGNGHFLAEPETIQFAAGTDMTYALSTLDMDRDGNPDYISGGPGGENLLVVIDEQYPTTDLLDELVVTGYSSVSLEVVNPGGFINSQYEQTIAGADYWRNDVNDDGLLDEESYDYNLQYGEYAIIISPRPGAESPVFSIGVRVDGTYSFQAFLNYNAFSRAKDEADDSIVFYYTIESESSIQPPNGASVSTAKPTFDWDRLVELVPGNHYDFQLDRYYDFRSPIYDVHDLTEPVYSLPTELGLDSLYYWRIQSEYDGEWSRTFAVYILPYICGDANSDNKVNVSDAVYIINFVFSGGTAPNPLQSCDGNCDDKCNVSDAVYLINFVFSGGHRPCDTNGDLIPEC